MEDVDSAVADTRSCSPAQYSFVLLGLLGRLGDLARSGCLLIHALNDPHCHRLTHVTYSKAPWERETKRSFFPHLGISYTKNKRLCHLKYSPRGGYSEKLSTHIGLPGIMSTMAASPDLSDLGLSSNFFPERRSIFSFSSANLQAMWAVWQSRTGA